MNFVQEQLKAFPPNRFRQILVQKTQIIEKGTNIDSKLLISFRKFLKTDSIHQVLILFSFWLMDADADYHKWNSFLVPSTISFVIWQPINFNSEIYPFSKVYILALLLKTTTIEV